MKKNILMLSAITATLLFTGCTKSNESISVSKKDMTTKEIKMKAKKAIILVGGTLKKTMGMKMKEGGATKTAEFCSVSAEDLAKKVSKKLDKGVTVKRITNKPRNSKNMATKEQLEILKDIEAKMKQGNMPKMLVKKISDNHYQVYKPFKVGDKCIVCHGTEQTRDENAYKIISSKYPNDKAIDYKTGDLRGAFLVNIINK